MFPYGSVSVARRRTRNVRETVVARVHMRVHARVRGRARERTVCACLRLRRYARTRGISYGSERVRGAVSGRRSIMYRGLPLTSNFPNTAIIAVIIMARSF